jgi:LysM repeat protein
MKILKIFGIVVGIHLFALIFIFASPGCSSTSKPTPAPVDTVARETPPPSVNLPYSPPLTVNPGFNPDAPATSGGSSLTTGSPIFRPTRPGSTAAQAVTATPVTDVTPATTYTVKAGDTLWELGKKFKIPYGEIATANSLKSTAPLHQGQKLVIPGKSIAAAPVAASTTKAGATNGKAPATMTAAVTPAATAASGSYKHMVAPGESLSAIAHKYGVSVKELGTANNISDPAKVQAGALLVIPGWTAAGGAAAKGSTKSGKSSATTAAPPTEPKPAFNLLDSAPVTPKGDAPPVIKVEDSPLTPKSN